MLAQNLPPTERALIRGPTHFRSRIARQQSTAGSGGRKRTDLTITGMLEKII